MADWISVEDALPGEYHAVLVYSEGSTEADYGFIGDTGWSIYDPNEEYGIKDVFKVTHWQYPPDPPK